MTAESGESLTQQIRVGENRELRVLAAKGLVPVPLEELVTLQVYLVGLDDIRHLAFDGYAFYGVNDDGDVLREDIGGASSHVLTRGVFRNPEDLVVDGNLHWSKAFTNGPPADLLRDARKRGTYVGRHDWFELSGAK